MYQFKDNEELRQFIADNVLGSSEATDFLGIGRSRLSTMIKDGKITPIKKLPKDSLFLKSDLELKKKELGKLRKKYRPYDE